MKIEDLLIPDYDTTNLVLAYPDAMDPVSKIVAPQIPMSKLFNYLVFAKGNFRFTEKTDRAIGDMNVKYLKAEGGTWTPGFLVEHPLALPLDRQVQGREGALKELAQVDSVEAGAQVRSALEQELCTSIIASAVALGAGYYATPTTKWDASGAKPGSDIAAAAAAFFANCGLKPTHFVIPWTVMTKMADNLRAEYGVTQNVTDQAILERVVLDKCGIPAVNILIAGQGVYNSATAKYVEEWSDNCLLFYSKPKPTKYDLVFMATMIAKDKPAYWQYAPYATTQQTGVEVQGVMEYKVVRVCDSAGYLLKDVLT